jgi:hypothetical protein
MSLLSRSSCVISGGGWGDVRWSASVANRYSGTAHYRYGTVSLRLMRRCT